MIVDFTIININNPKLMKDQTIIVKTWETIDSSTDAIIDQSNGSWKVLSVIYIFT